MLSGVSRVVTILVRDVFVRMRDCAFQVISEESRRGIRVATLMLVCRGMGWKLSFCSFGSQMGTMVHDMISVVLPA